MAVGETFVNLEYSWQPMIMTNWRCVIRMLFQVNWITKDSSFNNLDTMRATLAMVQL